MTTSQRRLYLQQVTQETEKIPLFISQLFGNDSVHVDINLAFPVDCGLHDGKHYSSALPSWFPDA